MSTFSLEKRAEELFPHGHAVPRYFALQLATEALEAAAKECEKEEDRMYQDARPHKGSGLGAAANIIRSFIEKPGAQEERAPRVQSSPDASHGERVSADGPPAPLSDAKIARALEIAAARLRIKLDDAMADRLVDAAAKLRAAYAPVDVFEAFGRLAYEDHHVALEADAREWFGPLVSALEEAKALIHKDAQAHKVLARALSELRERARAARGGR